MRLKYIVTHGIRIAKDFVPETFGRLTALGPKFQITTGPNRSRAMQVYQCSCGEVFVGVRDNLMKGRGGTCPCVLAIIKTKATTHGYSKNKLYAVHRTMLARCYNENNANYSNYGARGIGVCDRWRAPAPQGFLNYLSDLPERPSDKHSVDRKDTNGNYCPENIRWATKSEQAQTRRNCQILTHNGQSINASEWAKLLGFCDSRIGMRLKAGWTVAEALDTPAGARRKTP